MEHRDWANEEADNSTDGFGTERDRVRMEFYATYDVMTGVRIAATLGGFFALMVFLIVYKSRSKSVKAMNDPKLVELAEAVVAEEQAEEEERQLTAALEDALAERARSRGSLGEVPPWPRTIRLGSFPSGPPVSARRFSAPRPRDRRLSSATCSSSASSYLEKRGSSVGCALPFSERRLSPCPSERFAPLARDCELTSVGPDSVFAEDSAPSTDDELVDVQVEQFSTDSGGGEGTELAHRPQRPVTREHSSKETLF